MDSRKVNLHYQKVESIQMKEKPVGNEIWGQEYMYFCLREVDTGVLLRLVENILVERVVSGTF